MTSQLLVKNRTTTELVQDAKDLTQEIQKLYRFDEIPWVIGYSGGKDSTAVLQLVWNAIAELPPNQRTKKIDVITTDTLVENPIVSAWVRSSLKQIEKAAREQEMPIIPHLLQPEYTETFWVGLIGKGYPPPRGKFRWCTERLKINPSNRFIRNVIRNHGETVLVLGTRKAESSKRAYRMKQLETQRVRDRLSPNMNLPNSLVYTPIEDWRNDEVWLYLNQWQNPWGCSNKDLFTMYRGASTDNECPLVVDTSTPTCGNSRFGCWVCTLVSQDKSLTAMIQNDEQKDWLYPLLNLRADLDVEDSRDRRDFRRRNGSVQLYERNLDGKISVEPIPGPFTKKARENWLRKLLATQNQIRCNAPPEFKDITLIALEELSEIRRIWLEERHEFDDSLPKIYKEVTGETFEDSRPGAGDSLLGADEWSTLEELCGEDAMHLELMAKLIDTERQYYTKSRRSGILSDLEKCFDTSSRSRKEAIDNAHLKRDLKEAVGDGNVAAIKQLTIGNAQSQDEVTETEEKVTATELLTIENVQSQDEVPKMEEEEQENISSTELSGWGAFKYAAQSEATEEE
ncbi:DNA phosphorothioation system sulfurtransferase DndC [Lusitaniella coriacea LEGE 07157]|uniref:DNA phosphorothioation system sulfurtransferase DndC n=1 Tax=Lusitaniella coriacea LEGE 07157 TaxID=945747 RepID=A0A8J7AP86_9CYAN|nr:DNA phosphorothioation system sulfurtransferase DndC [Lusitaniella coriacea]MBE9115413.1 DNA phosphorothioation system sulfurtransferase DndC [Lusitaniella coriacea LEGE 07157]